LISKKRTAILFFFGGVICFVLAAFMVWNFSGRFTSSEPTTVAGPMLEETEDPEANEETVKLSADVKEEQEDWVIYITGSVRMPGVYEVSPGSRVYQAVDKAGGMTPDADPVAINLALPLADGVHIHVPARGEAPVDTSPQNTPAGNDQARTSASSSSENHRIDINSADTTLLQTLKGVGPKTAASIVSYRKENGSFRSVEELLKVKGIGPKKLDALRDCVTCSHR
jgi:competence protein ComEA